MKNIFSIVILMKNPENIKEVIKISKVNYSNQIEIILLDLSKKIQKDTIEKYKNIHYIEVKGNKSEAYNIGLNKAKGNYITFIEDGMFYGKYSINLVKKAINKSKSKILLLNSLSQFNNKNNYCLSCPEKKEIDLKSTPDKIVFSFEAYFFETSLIKEFKFDEKIHFEDAKLKFLLQAFLKYPHYYYLKSAKLYHNENRYENIIHDSKQYDIEWYNNSLNNFINPFLENIQKNNGEIPNYIQTALLYSIYQKYKCNINDKNKITLSKQETASFIDCTTNILQYIEDNIILDRQYNVPTWLYYQLILRKKQKNNINTNVEIENQTIYMVENDKKHILGNIEEESANIYAINYNKSNNNLEIDFTISVQAFMNRDDVETFVKYREKKIEAKKTDCYPLLKCFGMTMSKKIPFNVSIKLTDIKNKDKFSIYFKYKGKEYKLHLKFIKIQSHLSNSKYSYWRLNKKYYLTHNYNEFILEKKRVFSGFKKEILYFIARFIKSNKKVLTIKNFLLRFIYFIVHPVMKNKRIWIYYDKIYKGGDNAEYLYKYAANQDDSIEHYYIINRDSNDYKRLKDEKAKLLVFGTIKLKIYSLYAEAILATHKNVASFCSFGKNSRENFRDLFNAEIICIQHGLTMQDIAQHQNRIEDNTKLYLCASKYEIQNLSNPIYDYNKESLKLVGLARFDGLINKDKRQILISPTWRKSAANTNTRMGNTREYIEEFKHSEYFNIFNNIINNENLMDTAKKYNYKIIFLLHPVITAQACDFDKNENVTILTVQDGISYEQLLTESSLMVTDYSGIQYDFSYMRKPIIYFHPDELPAQYGDGGINYETMGFGPICKNQEDLINTICDYMENDCKTEQEYIDRANDFFSFDDYNNCERIYDTIKEYMKGVK